MSFDINLLVTKVLIKEISIEEAANCLGLTYHDFVSLYLSGTNLNEKEKSDD